MKTPAQFVYECEVQKEDGSTQLAYTARKAPAASKGYAKRLDTQMNKVTNFFCDTFRESGFKKLIIRRVSSY